MKKKNYRTAEECAEAVKNSLSIAQVCKYLNIKPVGGNYKTVHQMIEKYGLDTSHFTGKGWNVGNRYHSFGRSFKLEDILKENSTYQSFKLKLKLFESGIKERRCECCKFDTWNNLAIPLELHHKNGNNTDNRLENLQILCPNCHAQTKNYRGMKKSASFPKGENDN